MGGFACDRPGISEKGSGGKTALFSLDYLKMTKAGVEGADVGSGAGMEGHRLGCRARGSGGTQEWGASGK